MKKGDKITMYFHLMGVTSEEQETIHEITDTHITIYDESDNCGGYKFNRKTGKCLNDNTFGGASRTIKLQ